MEPPAPPFLRHPIMHFYRSCAAVALTICVLLFPTALKAGPPFITDDPEPVETGHWEFYTAADAARDKGGISGTLPHLELNYGAFRNTQPHLIVPAAFSRPAGGSFTWFIIKGRRMRKRVKRGDDFKVQAPPRRSTAAIDSGRLATIQHNSRLSRGTALKFGTPSFALRVCRSA